MKQVTPALTARELLVCSFISWFVPSVWMMPRTKVIRHKRFLSMTLSVSCSRMSLLRTICPGNYFSLEFRFPWRSGQYLSAYFLWTAASSVYMVALIMHLRNNTTSSMGEGTSTLEMTVRFSGVVPRQSLSPYAVLANHDNLGSNVQRSVWLMHKLLVFKKCFCNVPLKM